MSAPRCEGSRRPGPEEAMIRVCRSDLAASILDN
jgi:hypothetical protein